MSNTIAMNQAVDYAYNNNVPVIAAAGGMLFLGEDVSQRLLVATLMIIGGIAITVYNRS